MKQKRILTIAVMCLAVYACSSRGPNQYDDMSSGLTKGRAVCGSSSIRGEYEDGFSNGACGIRNPVRVYSVAGVELENSALVNCKTANALEHWVNNAAKPTAKAIDKRLKKMRVAASYACRNRNHKKKGKLSEHAKGNAIDISAFTFTDGTTLTVEGDYYRYARYFRKVQKQACGTFGTVLGPGFPQHDDHFHFDVAHYSYGPYCK